MAYDENRNANFLLWSAAVKSSKGKTIAIVAALIVLVGLLALMNRANDDAMKGVNTGVAHDHDGDGKPDH